MGFSYVTLRQLRNSGQALEQEQEPKRQPVQQILQLPVSRMWWQAPMYQSLNLQRLKQLPVVPSNA
jgi:hypothetical protein